MKRNQHEAERTFVADFETTTTLDKTRVWAYAICDINNTENVIIGNNHRIVVPSAFYKVFLRKNHSSWTTIGFVFENVAGNKPLMTYMTSVDEVENMTGIDFFYNLPDSIEELIESDFHVSEWTL